MTVSEKDKQNGNCFHKNLSIHNLELNLLDSSCDSTQPSHDSTRTRLKKFFKDADSKGLWLLLDSDTKMTRAHHWLMLKLCVLVKKQISSNHWQVLAQH